MLRRYGPVCDKHLLMSDSETESDNLSEHRNFQALKQNKRERDIGKGCHKSKKNKKEKFVEEESSRKVKALKEEPDSMMKHAKRYEQYMKQVPIPTTPGSIDIPFITWQGLAKSMQQLYGQPLHYLTHVLVNKWDQSRIGTEEENKPLSSLIHPNKAEDTIWGVEEVHRRCTSHVQLAKLWLCDPGYHAFVDEVIPPPS